MKNMVSKEQKIKEIKEHIKNNPSLNSNEILKEIRLKGLGIRKTDFLKIFREQKQLPEPSKAKREKATPIKFRKPITKEKFKEKFKEKEKKERKTKQVKIDKFSDKPTKEGQYGVIEVIDKEGNSFWIKYQNEKDFNRQLEKLKPSIQSDRLKFISHGFRKYISFVDKEFMELLKSEGINS